VPDAKGWCPFACNTCQLDRLFNRLITINHPAKSRFWQRTVVTSLAAPTREVQENIQRGLAAPISRSNTHQHAPLDPEKSPTRTSAKADMIRQLDNNSGRNFGQSASLLGIQAGGLLSPSVNEISAREKTAIWPYDRAHAGYV